MNRVQAVYSFVAMTALFYGLFYLLTFSGHAATFPDGEVYSPSFHPWSTLVMAIVLSGVGTVVGYRQVHMHGLD